MNIEKMTIKDYEEVHALWIRTPSMGLNTLDDSLEGIQRFLQRNPSSCFIARENGKIQGVILSGHDGRRGFIYHLAVSMGSRRKGIGSALLSYSLDALRKEGITKVACVVFSRNEGGTAFWEEQGFTVREDLAYRNKVITDLTLERIDT